MKFFEFLQQANSEDNGHPSSMRSNIFLAIVCWIPSIGFGFVWVVLNHPDLTITYLSLLLGAVLVALGLKNAAKDKEELTNGLQKVTVPVMPSIETAYPDGTVKTVTEEAKP